MPIPVNVKSLDDVRRALALLSAQVDALAAGGGGSGDVVGPASSVDDRIAAFDGTTGKLIKQGTVTAAAVASAVAAIATAGDVDGPASSTDNAVARFDGTTGKVIQQSVVIVSDAGDVSGIDDQDMTGHLTMERISTPSAPAVNHGRLFTRLNGGNICLIFQSATGAELDIGCILNVADTQTLPKDKVQ